MQLALILQWQRGIVKLCWIVVVAVVGLLVERFIPHAAAVLAEPVAKAAPATK